MITISIKKNTVVVEGEVDIFCADNLKERLRDEAFTENFVLDLQKVRYIDSSGIGVLISLYNHYSEKNVYFHVVPSKNVREIFYISKLDSLFFEEKQRQEDGRGDKIVFYDSFEADTRILSFIIDRLFRDLEKAGYAEDEGQEIVVAVDEAITNAIMETIKATGEVEDDLLISFDRHMVKSIAVRWEISAEEFFATIIDHGSGLDLEKVQQQVPKVTHEDYLAQVKDYQKKCNIHLRVNGCEVELKRLGAGLKIMTSFMDAIFIDLIDSEKLLSDKVDKSTVGTILNLYRKRRPAS